jgi:hypothetical protein
VATILRIISPALDTAASPGSVDATPRRPHRHEASTVAPRAVDGVHHAHQHAHHMDSPPSTLPTPGTPSRRPTPGLCTGHQAPQSRLSYNFLYWFKAARSAPRARPGPRPGLRSCLRPAPARPAPGPRP